MSRVSLIARIKPWMLPIAMSAGVMFHEFIDSIAFLSPYLIFAMLFITFSRLDMRQIQGGRFIWMLLGVQTLGAIALYLILRPLNEIVAQGVFVCVFCPTATAAPVITGMLGGSVARLVTFSLVSNITVAVTAPALFAIIGGGEASWETFFNDMSVIAGKVVPLLIAPLPCALALRRFAPKVHRAVAGHQSLSFYIWAVALFIVVGRAVSFAMAEPPEAIPSMLMLAAGAALACGAQFAIGRRIGAATGDKIAGAQGLGQKNTVLAVWMAMTWLNPVTAIAPASYVAWQNTVNSLQLYYRTKKKCSATV